MIGVAIANSLGLSSADASTDPAASAYFTATGITGATQQQAINTLVKSLKSNNIWSKMKAVYPFVTDNINLLGYTEDFGNAAWFKQSTTVTTNTSTAPNGTLTADTALFSSSTPSFVRASTIPITSGQTYTISVYVKKSASSGANNIRITTNDTLAWNTGITQKFSLTTSWQRITLTGVINSSVNVAHIIFGSTNLDGTVDATCGGNVDMWGAQLELGSTATSYQPIATTQQAFISNQFKYNLVNPVDSDSAFRLVFNGGWTHSANGATPNGTNGWADTNLNPSGNITGQNSHISFYSRTQSDGLYADLGYGGSMELLTQSGNILYADFPDTTRSQIGNTNSTGLFIVSNTSTAGKKVFRNNSAIISSTFVNADFVFNASYKFTLSNYNNSVLSRYSNRQNAFTSIGDGLTDAESLALYNVVNNYQVALSRNV